MFIARRASSGLVEELAPVSMGIDGSAIVFVSSSVGGGGSVGLGAIVD